MKSKIAQEKFEKGYRCSEAILCTYAEQFGLDENIAMKIACGLGGGFGKNGDLCGCVTASVLVIGLKFGRTNPENITAKNLTDDKVKEFLTKFEAEKKHLKCKDLIGYDVSGKEGFDSATDAGVFKEICPCLLETSVKILDEIIK